MRKSKPRRDEFVRVGAEIHRVLKIEAAKRGISMKELSAEAVRAYLKRPAAVEAVKP